jgi:hypothetical protein
MKNKDHHKKNEVNEKTYEQPQHLKKQINSTIDDSNQNKKEMEVHIKPKENKEFKLKMFLYEFFIIFLAVSVSFFVENIRERYIDHHKELQYIQSLANDVKIDTLELSKVAKTNAEQIKGIYNFLGKLENPDSSKKTINYIYYYSIVNLNTIHNFVHTDRTISQLKNAGGLRLIKSKAVSDSIVNYDALVNDVEVNGDICLKFFYDLLKQQRELLDFKMIQTNNFTDLLATQNLKLLKNDKYSIDLYYNNSLTYASLLSGYKDKLENLKKHAENLLKTLGKEYDIK